MVTIDERLGGEVEPTELPNEREERRRSDQKQRDKNVELFVDGHRTSERVDRTDIERIGHPEKLPKRNAQFYYKNNRTTMRKEKGESERQKLYVSQFVK
ncbi:hypothetical protein [uncultured Jannaschia sp.]|uniref:hypothetical protein n=1 Tax=uncultured Jannaschia sp. TaxID=293347 RepID=UPI002624635C|nr:hypothetical protein [uncultured Jannaschia sp.]